MNNDNDRASPVSLSSASTTALHRSAVVRSKIFERKRVTSTIVVDAEDAAAGTGPLHQCLEWIADMEHCNNGTRRFSILSHELSARARSYEAADETHLRRWASTRIERRLAHEVIWCATKLFVDIDAEWQLNADVAEHVERLVRALVDEAERHFDVECSWVVLDASERPTKFSRHIIIDMRRRSDGRRVVFETARHCGAFVAHVERSLDLECVLRHSPPPPHAATATTPVPQLRPLCDHAVYARNHTLRTYGSNKLDANRPLRVIELDGEPVDRIDEVARGVLDADVFIRSLVTMPRVTDEACWVRATDNMLERFDSRRSSSRASLTSSLSSLSRKRRSPSLASSSDAHHFTHEPSDTISRAIETYDRIASCGIRSMHTNSDSTVVVVNVRSRQCDQIGRTHRSNTQYFVVDMRRGMVSRRCHDGDCVRAEWQPLDDDAPEQLRRLSSPSSSSEMVSTQPIKRSASAPPVYGEAMLTLFGDFSRATSGAESALAQSRSRKRQV